MDTSREHHHDRRRNRKGHPMVGHECAIPRASLRTSRVGHARRHGYWNQRKSCLRASRARSRRVCVRNVAGQRGGAYDLHSKASCVNAINRFFLAAMTAAVLYFLGEFIDTTFLGGHESLQLVVAGLFTIIHIPAVPFMVLFPNMSRTLTLFIACLGWGALVELYHLIER